jgi:hypothetical protein
MSCYVLSAAEPERTVTVSIKKWQQRDDFCSASLYHQLGATSAILQFK